MPRAESGWNGRPAAWVGARRGPRSDAKAAGRGEWGQCARTIRTSYGLGEMGRQKAGALAPQRTFGAAAVGLGMSATDVRAFGGACVASAADGPKTQGISTITSP